MALNIPAQSAAAATRMRTAALTGLAGLASVSIAFRFRIVARDNGTIAHTLWTSTGASFNRKVNTTNNYQFAYQNNSEASDILELGFISTGRWHVLLFTFTAGSQAVYIDGKLKDTGVLPAMFFSPAGFMEVGVSGSSHDVEYWDICMWNKVLSSSERLALRGQLLGSVAVADRLYNWELVKKDQVINVNTTTHAVYLNELVDGTLDLSTITSGTPKWNRANALGETVPGNRAITARHRGGVNRRTVRSR